MMRHPVYWLEDCESLDVEKELSKFNLVLRGHIHDEDSKQITCQKVNTIYSAAGKLFPLDFVEGKAIDGYNGYSILGIDMSIGHCHIWVHTYLGKDRKEWVSGADGNVWEPGVYGWSEYQKLEPAQEAPQGAQDEPGELQGE